MSSLKISNLLHPAPSVPPIPVVPADDETAVRELSSPDETESSTEAPVDDEDQPPAADHVAAAILTTDTPGLPSAEEEAEATVVEASTEPTTVPDVTDTIAKAAVAVVELDEAAENGEFQQRVGCEDVRF